MNNPIRISLPILALAIIVLTTSVAHAVTVGPIKLEYLTDPGKTIKGKLFLQNEEGVVRSFYPSFEKFTEVNGEKSFTKEKSDLSTWFQIEQKITLKPGEGKQIPFKINVPNNAPPGGHFTVIWWSTSPPSESGEQVSIVTRAGILVYLTVSGNVRESGSLSNFSGLNRFSSGAPFTFNYTVTNTGNTYLKPVGELVIKNIFGKKRAGMPANQYGTNILPQSSRDFNEQIQSDNFFFGIYRAELNIAYNASGQQTSQNFWFFVLPWGASVITILVLLFIFLIVPRGIRKYNAWIIQQARDGNK